MEDDWTPVGRNMKRRERAHRAAKHNDKNRRRGAQAGTHLGGRAHRRAHRAAVAEDTLRVLAEDPAAYAAAEGTVQHGEDPPVFDKPAARDTAVAFECCTTLHACRRIVLEQGHRCAALVFGSAKNPGGGFLKGALAQEESIAAASALYWCTHDAELYARNDADPRRNLYHNLALYCPDVPVIKDDDGIAVHRHTISMVVCPAPNAGAARASKDEIDAALRRRIHLVLAVAAHHGERTYVLGAFGAGVFRNDPNRVAEIFADELRGPFRGSFDRVVFAIPSEHTLDIFRRHFQ